MVALVLVVGCASFLAGVKAGIVALDERELRGIEVVLFPIAAIAGAMLRPWPRRVTGLRTTSIGPWLPLLAAVALVAISCLLGWSWTRTTWWLGLERWPGAVLISSAALVGATLFPRLTSALAGAIAAPALFGILSLTFPYSLNLSLANHHEYNVLGLLVGVEGVLMLAAGFAGGAMLLAAWLKLRSRILGHAAWTGAIMLPLAVYLYVFAWVWAN